MIPAPRQAPKPSLPSPQPQAERMERQKSAEKRTSTASKRTSMPPPPPPQDEVHYTVLIRVPFARGDFVDPAPVDWNATKDRALFKISRNSRSSDLDWKALAEHFQVSLPFLLQQAAWLYERELSQVRAQMRRVGKEGMVGSGAPSPIPGSASGSMGPGGLAMKRTISGRGTPLAGPAGRARDSPIPREGSGGNTPVGVKNIGKR
jgi:Atg29 N-terminal domain